MSENNKRTNEFKAFNEGIMQNMEIIEFFFTLMAGYVDNIEPDSNELRGINISKELNEKAVLWFRKYEILRRWMIEVTITRSVDAFDHYLTQILLKVFTKRPDIFKASEYKADVRDFIEAGSVPEFIKRFAE